MYVMMDSMITSNIVHNYKAGWDQNLSISRLQFANDTLILGEKVGLMFGLCRLFFTSLRQCLG